MKTIEEILDLTRPASAIISDLKNKQIFVPSWSSLEKKYDPMLHDIIKNRALRPDDKRNDKGKIEKVAKLIYPAEKIAVRKMTQMCFTIPVKRDYKDVDNEEQKEFVRAVEKVYESNRIDGLNYKRFKAFFACCEMCTIWFPVDTKKVHYKYGFPTTIKLRCKTYTPMPQAKSGLPQAYMYPIFDAFDDLVAFSIEYDVVLPDRSKEKHFECYTADKVFFWIDKGSGQGWELSQDDNNVPIGKIQLSYIYDAEPLYNDISIDRDEIEFNKSRQSDLIRKNSRPIMKVIGKILGQKPVGDTTREVYEMAEGGDIGVVAPPLNVDASIKHTDNLKKDIEESTQMPNLALENIKSLSGVVSGEARKTLLSDAHLKVGEKKHDLIWFLDREMSVVKSLVAELNVQWRKYVDTTTCYNIITPFVQNDERSEIENRKTANGGKPIESQLESIQRFDRSSDPEQTYNAIKQEEKESAETARMESIFTGAE